MRILFRPLFFILLAAVLGGRASGSDSRVTVKIVADEADAVLAILQKIKNNAPVSDHDWQTLFATEGYVRLKKRETSMKRPFTDEEFKSFVNSDDLLGRYDALSATLASWKSLDVTTPANRALAYLPPAAVIRAKIYPVIKPRDNSFVFEVKEDPAIFVYLDPSKTREQFDNILAHELHHIGFGTACPPAKVASAIEKLPAGNQKVVKLAGAFGEGFAMLAAAGGPEKHPHEFSLAEDKQRWDRDVANFGSDLAILEAFFHELLEHKLTDDAAIEKFRSFFGVQGPWYTVGWQMAVVIEKTYGRGKLIDCFCDDRKLFRTYNKAAPRYNKKNGTKYAYWSEDLLRKIN